MTPKDDTAKHEVREGVGPDHRQDAHERARAFIELAPIPRVDVVARDDRPIRGDRVGHDPRAPESSEVLKPCSRPTKRTAGNRWVERGPDDDGTVARRVEGD